MAGEINLDEAEFSISNPQSAIRNKKTPQNRYYCPTGRGDRSFGEDADKGFRSVYQLSASRLLCKRWIRSGTR